MKKCAYEDQVDDYLLDRLEEAQRVEFEEHYFNCPSCFEKIKSKDDVLSVIREQGHRIFNDTMDKKPRKMGLIEALLSFSSPRRWAVAAISAALIVVAVILVGTVPKTPGPQFVVNDDVLRGASLTLVSPLDSIEVYPIEFKWESFGEDVEYRIYIYNSDLLWSGTTKEISITLPDEESEKMTGGGTYSWQVKAFSAQGALMATSKRGQFEIPK